MKRLISAAFAVLLAILILTSSALGESADIRVYFDGILSCRGRIINGAPYVALEDICSFAGIEYESSFAGNNFEFKSPALQLTASSKEEYLLANHRYVYVPDGFALYGDKLYIPLCSAADIFGLDTEVSEDMRRVDIDSSGMDIISGWESYYDDTYDMEDVFWLSRIIHSEAKTQPMAGMIGVGNVVLNRVASEHFPNTIFDVVFDNETTIQFTPVANGSIYLEPDANSLVAAYLCLEGCNTVGECMYFVAPALGDSTWFREELRFVMSIGDHDFYSK